MYGRSRRSAFTQTGPTRGTICGPFGDLAVTASDPSPGCACALDNPNERPSSPNAIKTATRHRTETRKMRCFMSFLLFFSALCWSYFIAGPGEAKNLAEKTLRLFRLVSETAFEELSPFRQA